MKDFNFKKNFSFKIKITTFGKESLFNLFMRKSIFLLLVLFRISLFAQDPVPLVDEPGTWSYNYLNDANTQMYIQKFGMTPMEIADFKIKMDKLVEVLHHNPVMQNPLGFDVSVESRPYYMSDFNKHPENYGYIGEINFRLPEWFMSKGKKYKQTIEPPRTTVYINNITFLRHSAFNTVPVGNDKRLSDMVNDICRPMVIKELMPGVILYDYAIVLASTERSLYLPCSVGEAYSRLMAYYEAASKTEQYYAVILEPLKEEYRKLTPEQLKSPAYFGGMTGITYAKNQDPLMLINNNFFDRSKPKTAVQAIVFPIDADYFRKESDFVRSNAGFLGINRFLNSLDVKAIAGLVE